jgi:hypothetical protein
MPHEDLRSRRFETASGIAALLFLAAARGPLDPAVVGPAACRRPSSSSPRASSWGRWPRAASEPGSTAASAGSPRPGRRRGRRSR